MAMDAPYSHRSIVSPGLDKTDFEEMSAKTVMETERLVSRAESGEGSIVLLYEEHSRSRLAQASIAQRLRAR